MPANNVATMAWQGSNFTQPIYNIVATLMSQVQNFFNVGYTMNVVLATSVYEHLYHDVKFMLLQRWIVGYVTIYYWCCNSNVNTKLRVWPQIHNVFSKSILLRRINVPLALSGTSNVNKRHIQSPVKHVRWSLLLHLHVEFSTGF